MRLLSDHARLLIEVWDTVRRRSARRLPGIPGQDEESGRGLEIVETLSEDWGWESVPGWHGKRSGSCWARTWLSGSRIAE